MKLNHFNFRQFGKSVLLTNDFGDYIFLSHEEFKKLLAHQIDPGSDLENRLTEKRFIYSESNLAFSHNQRYDLREAKGFLQFSTSLHIFVVTTTCNMSCVYCQANSGKGSSHLVMDDATAEKAVDIALQSPTKFLNFEFQGGEPLVGFSIIKHIVEYADLHKGYHEIEYNVVSNLLLLTDEMLSFFSDNHFGISTSLDGPQEVHDFNRPHPDGTGSFKALAESVKRVQAAGLQVGAIETTTRRSLSYPEQIVQTYADFGFDSIFIRPLTPLGKALLKWDQIGYTPEEYILFYRRALAEILRLNKNGYFFKESHAAIFLARIRGYTVNYMGAPVRCAQYSWANHPTR